MPFGSIRPDGGTKALPRFVAAIRGPTSKGIRREGRGGEGDRRKKEGA